MHSTRNCHCTERRKRQRRLNQQQQQEQQQQPQKSIISCINIMNYEMIVSFLSTFRKTSSRNHDKNYFNNNNINFINNNNDSGFPNHQLYENHSSRMTKLIIRKRIQRQQLLVPQTQVRSRHRRHCPILVQLICCTFAFISIFQQCIVNGFVIQVVNSKKVTLAKQTINNIYKFKQLHSPLTSTHTTTKTITKFMFKSSSKEDVSLCKSTSPLAEERNRNIHISENTINHSSSSSSSSSRRQLIKSIIRTGTSGVAASVLGGKTSSAEATTFDTNSTSFLSQQKEQSTSRSFGKWNQYDKSSSSLDATLPINTVPIAFSTYLTRFLIQYDTSPDGYHTYWYDHERMYQLLPSNEKSIQLSKIFGRMSKSTENAIIHHTWFSNKPDQSIGQQQQQYDKLWDILYSTYSNQPDAKRHIAILFTLLPPELQPLSCLQRYYNQERLQQPVSLSLLSNINDDNSPSFFDASYIGLLPSNYQITMSSSSNPLVSTVSASSTTMYFVTNPSPFSSLSSSSTSVASSSFGFIGDAPMIRDMPRYGLQTYSFLALAGASSCSLTHTFVIPLDVVKTRAQTNPRSDTNSIKNKQQTQQQRKSIRSKVVSSPSSDVDSNLSYLKTDSNGISSNIVSSAISIAQKEGIKGLLLGAEATIVGYFWYGLSVYPTYTFFKRYIVNNVVPIDYGLMHGSEIAIISGAIAAVIASLGITPIEAARIRVVAEPGKYRSLGLIGTLQVIATENPITGWKNLYAGLPPLLTRQVLFGSIKFVSFELASDYIYSLWPHLHTEILTQLIVTLVAGGCSGIIASVISQPADSVLTYIAAAKTTGQQHQQQQQKVGSAAKKVTENTAVSTNVASMSILDGLQSMIRVEGIGSLYRGLGSRCIWAGSIIGGQFFLYDIARTIFHVTGTDLSQIYELNFIE